MEQQRVFLAIALSLAVLFVWQYFFMPEQPAPQPDAQVGAEANPQGNGNGGAQAPSQANPQATPDAQAPTPRKEIAQRDDLVLQGPTFKATFTNKGARLLGFEILEPAQYRPRGDLIKPTSTDEEKPVGDDWLKYLPFGVKGSGQLPELAEDTMYEVVEATATGVVFRHEVPGVYTLEKRFTIDPKMGNFDLEVVVTNTSQLQLNDQLSLVLYGHQPTGSGEFSLFDPLPDVTEALCFADGSVERAPRDDAEEGMSVKDPSIWGGISSRYFLLTAINKDQPFVQCNFSLHQEEYFRSELMMEKLSLAPGQSSTWSMMTYIGPKLTETMAAYEVSLEQSIDYGFFAVLCRPIRWLLVRFYGFLGNWGLAIVLLTVLLRMLLWPINHRAYKSMEGMRKIQEPMNELREKYKNDPQKMQEEMMKLYKVHGVSPFGCLPQFLQIPIFFALYRTIYSSVELYHANFYGWYDDLSAPDPYFVLPILVGVAMVGQQFLMPTNTSGNPQMKYVMWAMPVMFSAFTFVLPSGLALYMLVSIGLGIGQQYLIRRSSNTEAVAA